MKLSPCIALFAKLEKMVPRNVLPPSFGTKLMRGPPVGSSALAEPVSIVTSAAAVMFAVDMLEPPPACSVPVGRPFCVMRMSTVLLPWIIRLVVVSPSAPPVFWVCPTCAGARLHAGDHRREVRVETARGDRVDDFLGHDALGRRALHVDDRRLAGDDDRFLDRADLHVGVDRHVGAADQLEAVALDGVEAGQREGHRVDARPEILDAVLTGAVGGDGTDLFDERRTRGLDGDAGQYGPGRVFHEAGNRRLRERH